MSADFKAGPLPLFPLNTVVFPGGRLSLRVFEQRYLDMVKQAIADETPFGVCAIREGSETGTPAVPHTVGTLVRVSDWDMPQTGILHVDTRAEERFHVRHVHAQPNGLLIGDVESVTPEAPVAVPGELELVVEILRRIVAEYGDAHFPPPHAFDDAAWVGYRLSEVLPLKLSTRQNLLEMNDSVMRLRILAEFLRKQIK